jgi:hypothetical protein
MDVKRSARSKRTSSGVAAQSPKSHSITRHVARAWPAISTFSGWAPPAQRPGVRKRSHGSRTHGTGRNAQARRPRASSERASARTQPITNTEHIQRKLRAAVAARLGERANTRQTKSGDQHAPPRRHGQRWSYCTGENTEHPVSRALRSRCATSCAWQCASANASCAATCLTCERSRKGKAGGDEKDPGLASDAARLLPVKAGALPVKAR